MKITITLDVPEGTTIAAFTPDVHGPGDTHEATYVPPFADELIPLPDAVIPLPDDATARQLMAEAVNLPPGYTSGAALLRTMAQNPSQDVCPVHRVPWKTVPAGVSKKSGKPYAEFRACPERGCDQRPAA